MKKIMAAMGIAAAALALGGCQAIFGGGEGARADVSEIDMGDYFAVRIAAGRQHLKANRPTRAVTAFRQASYDPRYAGEAFNGMAIAYDRLGRPDLAQQYFERAVAAAPSDPRFSRNLARFQSRVPLEPEQRVAEADVALDVDIFAEAQRVAPTDIAVDAPVTISRPSTQLVKSAGSTVLVTRATTAEPAPVAELPRAATREAVINVERRLAAQQRVQHIRRNAQARKSYPIRVVLRDREQQTYPIRIDLTKSDD